MCLVPLEEPKETGALGGKQGQEGPVVQAPTERERERERAFFRCGVAVRCSALWECVEVQWCCHGDKL